MKGDLVQLQASAPKGVIIKLGKIGGPTAKMLGSNIEPILRYNVYNVYSGNFAIEQTLYSKNYQGEVYSNDESLYNSSVGNYLAGQNMRLEVSDHTFDWLLPYLTTPESKSATVMLLAELLKHQQQRNAYEKRMYGAYIENWASLHEETIKRLESGKHNIVPITEFTSFKAENFVESAPKDSLLIANLPEPRVNYILEYSKVDTILSWENPEYKPLTQEAWQGLIDNITSRPYILFSESELELPLISQAQKGGGKHIRMYSNIIEKRGLVKSRLGYTVPGFKVITPEVEITRKSKIKIVKDRWHCMNYYRNIYLAKGIKFADGRLNLLVFLDDYLIGCIIYSPEEYKKEGAETTIYQLSDFVTGKHKYPRLSKLILLITQTKDIKALIDREFIQDTKVIRSTAFTEKTGSMKYRGIYEKTANKEGYVNYDSPTGLYTLKQALTIWIDKYNKEGKND